MYIDRNGHAWYKGNLHTHTTVSDGILTPAAVAALYAAKDYDFLALTDHWQVSEPGRAGRMLMLAGCEYDVGADPRSGIFHIVGVGMSGPPALSHDPQPTAQDFIDQINAAGGLAILAHPAWSLETPEQIRPLRGLAAAEIYNSVSDLPHNARPDSSLIIDQLATEDYRLPCIAADDSHFYDGEETKSYILVKSAACTRDALLAAIRGGDFIATQGPLFSMRIEDGQVVVDCSPVERIIFYSDAVYSPDRAFVGHDLTGAVYPLSGREHFLRVELVDTQGCRAWSSPLPLQAKSMVTGMPVSID